jgi:hypothetical protein
MIVELIPSGAAVVWIAIMAGAVASLMIAIGRRAARRGRDLGTVSDQWRTHYREVPSVDSR